jgi:hypothetical protein
MAAAASVALVTAPTMATAQRTPAPITQSVAPADETVDEGSELRGGFIIPLIAIIAIILGICTLGSICGGDEDDLPHSP